MCYDDDVEAGRLLLGAFMLGAAIDLPSALRGGSKYLLLLRFEDFIMEEYCGES